MAEMRRLSIRLTDRTLDALDDLAAEQGTDRTTIVRRLLNAGLRNRPTLTDAPLPTEDELLQILGERARAGNTSAARSLLARREARDSRAEALLAFVELANGGNGDGR